MFSEFLLRFWCTCPCAPESHKHAIQILLCLELSHSIKTYLFRGPKGTKGVQENCICLCAQQWISWKISLRINTKLDAWCWFCARGAFMLQEMWFLVLWSAERLWEFRDFAANQCVTVPCLIKAGFNREEQNTTLSMLRPLFLFCGKKPQTIPMPGNLPSLVFFSPDL